MRLCLTLLAGWGLLASACAAHPSCFDGKVMLPDERLVLATVNQGQAGRDLAAAVFAGDRDTVRRMLTGDPRLRTVHVPPRTYPEFAPDGQFGDLLTFAVARCDGRMLDLLLELGVPADGAVPGSALDLAVRSQDLTLAERLLRAGARPDPEPGSAIVPMLSVARAARPEAAELLLAAGADPNWRDRTGTTILQTAVDMDSMRVAEILVRRGGDPWAISAGGAMPAQGIAQPLQLASDAEEAARQRLIAAIRRPDRPWPPPAPAALREAIAQGHWPVANTPAAVVDAIRAQVAKAGARRNP